MTDSDNPPNNNQKVEDTSNISQSDQSTDSSSPQDKNTSNAAGSSSSNQNNTTSNNDPPPHTNSASNKDTISGDSNSSDASSTNDDNVSKNEKEKEEQLRKQREEKLTTEELNGRLSELRGLFELLLPHMVGANVINIGGNFSGAVGANSRFKADTVTSNQNSAHQTQSSNGSQGSKGIEHNFKNLLSVEEWFFEQEKIENQIHFLLVAVFASNSLEFINTLREAIKQSFHPPQILKGVDTNQVEPPPPATTMPAFKRSILTILQETQTKVSKGKYTLESGQAVKETVEFIKPTTQQYALVFLRSCPDVESFRVELTAWLVKICQSDVTFLRRLGTPFIKLTRSQAAFGLGQLARNDYGHYLNTVIRPWALSGDWFVRFNVGWILLPLVTDEQYSSSIFSLLTHWAKDQNNIYLQATAAAACSHIGLINIDKTLDIIKLLLASDFFVVKDPLYMSISLLYFNTTTAHKILKKFAEWSQQENNKLSTAILPLFLKLVGNKLEDNTKSNLEIEHEEGEEAGGNSPKPSNISIWDLIEYQIKEGNRELMNSIVILTSQGLIHPSARVADQTVDLIEEWIVEANKTAIQSITTKSTYRILNTLLKDTQSAPYIKRILSKKKFDLNKIALSLRSIQ